MCCKYHCFFFTIAESNPTFSTLHCHAGSNPTNIWRLLDHDLGTKDNRYRYVNEWDWRNQVEMPPILGTWYWHSSGIRQYATHPERRNGIDCMESSNVHSLKQKGKLFFHKTLFVQCFYFSVWTVLIKWFYENNEFQESSFGCEGEGCSRAVVRNKALRSLEYS